MDAVATIKKAKTALQKNSVIARPYMWVKEQKETAALKNNLHGKYSFDDAASGSDVACVVLAGYKPYLYPYVFPRLLRFLPHGIDVCIVTAGKHVEELRRLCLENGWSYISTQDNNVALAQNIAINCLPHAKRFFKLDEDIFVTDGFFERMLAAREHALAGDYRPGVIAPILPINGYGHMRVLERYGLVEEYTKRFEKPHIAADPLSCVEESVEAAKFLWGEGGFVPRIDEMARDFGADSVAELPCAVRFSIGAILMERAVWEEMGYFKVVHGFVGLGLDERQLCTWCTINSRPVMVSQNAVAGHFGFGSQNQGMRDYLSAHPEVFEM